MAQNVKPSSGKKCWGSSSRVHQIKNQNFCAFCFASHGRTHAKNSGLSELRQLQNTTSNRLKESGKVLSRTASLKTTMTTSPRQSQSGVFNAYHYEAGLVVVHVEAKSHRSKGQTV